ncbi:MAG: GDP-mannose 4,6-dehydratase [Armatimonadetes bacterium]|nr:GDP-mannose 4,6-dehydratase [Armatimonadota bacterium]
MKIMITGGCGFVGHHVVEHLLKNTNWDIYVIDKLSYSSYGYNRIRDIKAFDNKRIRFFSNDLVNPISEGIFKETSDVNYIIHLAAETHVDRSIIDPMQFVYANVVGTCNLLNFARQCKDLTSFCMFSTDEVFGPASRNKAFKENDGYNCTNPYAASKAGAEQLALSYMNTYDLPGFVVHCMNIFGERQHSEKFIPMCIKKILSSEEISIHGDKTKTRSGSRFYIHARNVADAILFLLSHFKQREIYNVVGEKEISNLDLAIMVASIIKKKIYYKIVDFHSSRPGHDLRYALDGSKLKELGWVPPISFDQSIVKVIDWTLKNPRWLN